MSIVERVTDITVALGRGIYSVGEDLVLGVERTAQGLGSSGSVRVSDIGYENRAMAVLLGDFLRYGITHRNSPLYATIVITLDKYYAKFPDGALLILAREADLEARGVDLSPLVESATHEAAKGAAYMLGRMLIAKQLAGVIAERVAGAIAATSAYRTIATRIGVSAGASATGAGIPFGLLMAQGLMQRSSQASARLQRKVPELHSALRLQGNLHLLYFLIEKPLEPYVEAISMAKKFPDVFEGVIYDRYGLDALDRDTAADDAL